MGDLVSMTPSTNPSRFRPRPAGETAEILFFTGVRYYRMPDAVPVAPVRVRKRKSAPRVEKPRLEA